MQTNPEYPERASELFAAAERFGISLRDSEPVAISRDAFHQFCEWYVPWSGTRDSALRKYLVIKPKLFRCYLPFSARVFALASEVVWYLDELVVRDPVYSAIVAFQHDDKQAGALLQALRRLKDFKEVIDSGYVLLMRDPELTTILEDGDDAVKALTEIPEVRSALDQAVRFGLAKRPNSNGEMSFVFKETLDSGETMGWYIPGQLTKGMSGPRIRVGEVLPEATAEAISEALGRDAFKSARGLYAREVARTLRAADAAAALQAAAIFDRPVDDVILNFADKKYRRPLATAATGIRLTLPYLEGVPPDQLLELRERVPNAFRDFRGRVSEIVSEAMKDEPEEAISRARARLEAELSKGLHQLETEFHAVSLKTRLEGYGAVVPAFGVLAASMIGIGSLEALSVAAVAGVGLAIKAAAESAKGRTMVKANPFYFVWEAQKRR